jgi:hypothetical protein
VKFLKFFKRRYPYAPIAFLGRKNVEKIFDADIKKLKELDQIKQSEISKDKCQNTELK